MVENFNFNNFSIILTKLKEYIGMSLKIAVLSLASYLIYNQLSLNNRTSIIYSKKSKILNMVAEKLGNCIYKPSIHLPTFISQLAIHINLGKTPMKFNREYIQMEDGAIFSLDWVIDPKLNNKQINNNKLLIILHGLSGGSESRYIRDIINGFLDENNEKNEIYRIVVLHNRGINDTPLMTPKSYNAAFTSDLHTAINVIYNRYPSLNCFCLGVSMGANIFVRYLASPEYKNSYIYKINYIKCLVSVSNPFDLKECELLNRNNVISSYLINYMKSYYKRHPILKNCKGVYVL